MQQLLSARYLILLFNLFFYIGYSQDQYLDSLNRVLKNAKHDTTRASLLVQIGETLYDQDPDSAITFWKKSVKICELNEKNPDQKIVKSIVLTQATLFNDVGVYYQGIGETDAALGQYERALKNANASKNKQVIGYSLLNIGNIYFLKGDLAQSLDYYQRSLTMQEAGGTIHDQGYCRIRIAAIYRLQKETAKALTYYEEAYRLFNKKDLNPALSTVSLGEISSIYAIEGDPFCKLSPKECKKLSLEKALKGYFNVLRAHQKTGAIIGIQTALGNIGGIYDKQGMPDSAMVYLKKVLLMGEERGDKKGVAGYLTAMASIQFDKGNISDAFQYASRSLLIAKELGYPNLIRSASGTLKDIYQKQGNYKQAFEMQELYLQMHDSINNESNRKSTVKKRMQFEYEKLAQKDSIMNVTKIEEARFKNEEAVARQRSYTYGGLIAFALMLLIAIVSLRAYRNKQKANIIITEQKQLADAQKQQIEIANKDLERQHLLNQKIFSVISHDFRGPMLSMSFLLDEFKEQNTDGHLNSAVSNVSSQLNNANDILNNLLNWARTEINIKDFDKSVTTIADTNAEVIKEFDQKLTAKKLSVESSIPANSQLAMPPDIFRITLRNLISNAIKFSYPETKITVVFDEKAGRLTVTDSGTGITAEKLQTLFRKQVNPGLGTGHEEGFGMGLYIVSELLYKYGYTITAESEAGKGASFRIERLAV